MKKIMFNDRYELTKKVLNGSKTQTRRVVPEGTIRMAEMEAKMHGRDITYYIEEHTPYCFLDEVAIAQSYSDIMPMLVSSFDSPHAYDSLRNEKGFRNKMFVRANLMPHRIRITGIKVERLQDISTEDCLAEGMDDDSADGAHLYWFSVSTDQEDWRKINEELSRHEWDGKKGSWFWNTAQGAYHALIDCLDSTLWQRNPWVYAYTFELIK